MTGRFFPAFVALVVVAAIALRFAPVSRWLAALDRLASRRAVCVALCAAIAFAGSGLVAWLVIWPEPRVHDEFGYLLTGDTFARGRLTNPTHPLWQHFESFHIFHEPTYAAKYPPAQGASIALGTLLTGEPLVGIWLGGAFMCAAICWMLYAFVSPRWALLGGLAATVQFGIASYWTQTYWGGALGAAGGALVFGAAPRLTRDGRARDAVVLGLGLLVLANSRPVDGAITSLAAAGYLAVALWRDPRTVQPAIAPLMIVLGIGAAAMGYYNRAVTGQWLLHPYVHHDRMYIAQPTMLLQDWREVPEYRHEELRLVHAGIDPQTRGRTGTAFGFRAMDRLRKFFVARGMLFPFVIGAVCAVLRPDGIMLLFGLAFAGVALGLLHYFQIHYAAAIAGPMSALVAIGLERIASFDAKGRRLGEAFCVAALLSVAVSLAAQIRVAPFEQTSWGGDDFYFRRLAAIETLTAAPGRDVVVVSYGPEHTPHLDWVYNSADIDGSDIVWARDMGAERNNELFAYFHDRKKWLLRSGFGKERDGLEPYPEP